MGDKGKSRSNRVGPTVIKAQIAIDHPQTATDTTRARADQTKTGTDASDMKTRNNHVSSIAQRLSKPRQCQESDLLTKIKHDFEELEGKVTKFADAMEECQEEMEQLKMEVAKRKEEAESLERSKEIFWIRIWANDYWGVQYDQEVPC